MYTMHCLGNVEQAVSGTREASLAKSSAAEHFVKAGSDAPAARGGSSRELPPLETEERKKPSSPPPPTYLE